MPRYGHTIGCVLYPVTLSDLSVPVRYPASQHHTVMHYQLPHSDEQEMDMYVIYFLKCSLDMAFLLLVVVHTNSISCLMRYIAPYRVPS